MVSFTLEDYQALLKWFELAFARFDRSKIHINDKKVFWKITFLIEDEIEKLKKHDEDYED
jgi:hypothetical protein